MKKYCYIFIIFSIIIVLTGCTDYDDSKVDNSDKYTDIITIATYTKKQYDSDKLQIGMMLTENNIDSFEKNESVSGILSNHEYSYKSAMNDKDTVIIQKNVIFQSATGYIATKKDTIAVTDDEYFRMDIPVSFGYDADCVSVQSCLGEFDGWYLYYYTAGL